MTAMQTDLFGGVAGGQPKKKTGGTEIKSYHKRFSKVEKELLYYVRKMWKANGRDEKEVLDEGDIAEMKANGCTGFIGPLDLDIYIPSAGLAINVDGNSVHQGMHMVWDEFTNSWCVDNDVDLIRVRGKDCPEIESPNYMTISYDPDDFPEWVSESFSMVLDEVAEMAGLDVIPDVDYFRDADEIEEVCRQAKERWDRLERKGTA